MRRSSRSTLMRVHAPDDALPYPLLHRRIRSLCRPGLPLWRLLMLRRRSPLHAGNGLAAHGHHPRQRGHLRYCCRFSAHRLKRAGSQSPSPTAHPFSFRRLVFAKAGWPCRALDTARSGWQGASLVAITYVYFLIFAQFAFLKRLATLGISWHSLECRHGRDGHRRNSSQLACAATEPLALARICGFASDSSSSSAAAFLSLLPLTLRIQHCTFVS